MGVKISLNIKVTYLVAKVCPTASRMCTMSNDPGWRSLWVTVPTRPKLWPPVIMQRLPANEDSQFFTQGILLPTRCLLSEAACFPQFCVPSDKSSGPHNSIKRLADKKCTKNGGTSSVWWVSLWCLSPNGKLLWDTTQLPCSYCSNFRLWTRTEEYNRAL